MMIELEQPDGGRAWVIAFSGFIISMILSGLSRMIGILYVAVIDTYGISRAEATLPFAIRNTVRCLSGPLVGIIATRFGIRPITFFGVLVAAAGAVLCGVAPNSSWLAVCWGGIHGIGFALSGTLFEVAVNQYFQKYRATASGISLSGACIGSFVFPFMMEAVLDEFSLSGGFLILGGIILHVVPFSLLLSVPQWIKHPKAYARLKSLKNAANTVSGDETSEPSKSNKTEEKLEKELSNATSLNNYLIENDICNISSKNSNKKRLNGIFNTVIALFRKRADTDNDVVCTNYRKNLQETPVLRQKKFKDSSSTSRVFSVSGQINEDSNTQTRSMKPVVATTNMKSKQKTQSISQNIRNFTSLYTKPMYVLISISMATYLIVFIPIQTIVVDYGIDKVIPESNGKYLINALAIGDLAGRLCFGWVTDKKLMTIPAFMTLILSLQGMFTALFPFAMSFTSFMVLLVLYSMAAGAIIVLFPVLVLQYVEYSSQFMAMACVRFLSGIMSFGIPSMIGHFRDNVGSYDGIFYLTGGISIMSGVLWLLVPILVKHCHDKKDQDNDCVVVVKSDFKALENETENKLNCS